MLDYSLLDCVSDRVVRTIIRKPLRLRANFGSVIEHNPIAVLEHRARGAVMGNNRFVPVIAENRGVVVAVSRDADDHRFSKQTVEEVILQAHQGRKQTSITPRSRAGEQELICQLWLATTKSVNTTGSSPDDAIGVRGRNVSTCMLVRFCGLSQVLDSYLIQAP